MPRARGNSSDRGNRFNTYVSGVTFQTNPSGVTIYKESIDATYVSASSVTGTVVSSTNLNATTIKGTNLKNAGGTGYVLPYLGAAGLLMDVGAVDNPPTTGVTKVDAAYFGFASIYFCSVSVGVTNLQTGAVTAQAMVTTAKPIPATGVSRVYFRAYAGNVAGSVLKRPASIQYFAVGV